MEWRERFMTEARLMGAGSKKQARYAIRWLFNWPYAKQVEFSQCWPVKRLGARFGFWAPAHVRGGEKPKTPLNSLVNPSDRRADT